MLTNDIPLIAKEHYEFIQYTAQIFRANGCEVHIITGITYIDLFYEEITRGKSKGKIKGYNFGFGFCKFRDLSKIKALNDFICEYDYQDIGIAFNEMKRQNQLNLKNMKKQELSILRNSSKILNMDLSSPQN